VAQRRGDSPRRDLLDLRYITEVVSRFDIVAIPEARGNLAAVRAVLEVIGPRLGLFSSPT
jgi:hypothetical protein